MRVLIDVNLYVAYLLNPHEDSFIAFLLNAVFAGQVTLLMPEVLLEELERTVRRKPRLINIISEKRLARLLELLRLFGEEVPFIEEDIPPVTRDPKDDYLVAYAVIGKADYLISGDNDLLVLRRIGSVSMVSSGQFRQILRAYKTRNGHAN
ncbi:MAG: putative toxin-antitoxin system toxin component, PIN family [Chloroflexi bacterium]|nr:putative toxin-antitoxin system toxin component, PIN family [Chloroflexota bacterium]